MGIHYIDGVRLKNAIVAGAQRVISLQEQLNKINVFPVPDGDTGTNMALTMKSVANAVLNTRVVRLDTISSAAAESALMGARGNSGAILAQFFQGLSESFEGQSRAHLHQFAKAVEDAAKRAREAIDEPQEGTILTVLHDWAACVRNKYEQVGDYVELISQSLEAARDSLQATPKKLKVLAKAGVVDAGAQGFVHLLEGVHHFMKTGKIQTMPETRDGGEIARASVEENTEDITFRYCTECFLRGQDLQIQSLRTALGSLGNSLIVAGSPQTLRIHIHTNEPEQVFETVAGFGEIASRKYEDMWAQHESAQGKAKSSPIAIVTDSTCDLPDEYLIGKNIRIVPLTLNFGNESYLDQITITNKEFYRKLQTDAPHPTTSQPAAADFRDAFALAAETHEKIIAILLSSALSGTYQAGLAAARMMPDVEIEVVDSCGLSGTLGLLVQVAVEAIEAGCDLAEVRRRVEQARQQARIFVSVDSMYYLVRGGRVSRMRGLLANVLNLRPVLTLSPEGRAITAAKTRAGNANREKTLELVKAAAHGLRDLRFIVVHAAAEEKAQYFAEQLKKYFEVTNIPVLQISPVLGAHAGPGTAAITFLGFEAGQKT